jgi:hypothetical protein
MLHLYVEMRRSHPASMLFASRMECGSQILQIIVLTVNQEVLHTQCISLIIYVDKPSM